MAEECERGQPAGVGREPTPAGRARGRAGWAAAGTAIRQAGARATRPTVRVLDRGDLEPALELCARDPVANAFVTARLLAGGVHPRSGAELWGWFDGGELRSMCWAGANLVPVEAGPEAVEAFAVRARRHGRHCSSIVGPADAVLALWRRLERDWGAARDVRDEQPLMAIDGPPALAADPLVRPARVDELELVIPACIAMFTEEVGYSPVAVDGGALYRSQVTSLVATGRSLVRVEPEPGRGPRPGRGAGSGAASVVFKAELGSVTPGVVQVQGVWVHPARRGEGLSAPGMAAVVHAARRSFAPVVSLYVNGFNTRALRMYQRVGFRQVGTFATVLF